MDTAERRGAEEPKTGSDSVGNEEEKYQVMLLDERKTGALKVLTYERRGNVESMMIETTDEPRGRPKPRRRLHFTRR